MTGYVNIISHAQSYFKLGDGIENVVNDAIMDSFQFKFIDQ